MAKEEVEASDLEEGKDKKEDGSAEESVGEELMLQSIIPDTPTTKIAEATIADHMLATARSLADSLTEGYYWQEQLLFITRLDEVGDAREQ